MVSARGLNEGKTRILLWERQSGEFVKSSDRINGLMKVIEFPGSSRRLLAGGKIKAYLTIYDVPGLQVLGKPLNIRLKKLEHIQDQKYLFHARDGPKPNHILDTEMRQISTLPGVSGGPAESVDINNEKNRIIGSFDTGELILWERR